MDPAPDTIPSRRSRRRTRAVVNYAEDPLDALDAYLNPGVTPGVPHVVPTTLAPPKKQTKAIHSRLPQAPQSLEDVFNPPAYRPEYSSGSRSQPSSFIVEDEEEEAEEDEEEEPEEFNEELEESEEEMQLESLRQVEGLSEEEKPHREEEQEPQITAVRRSKRQRKTVNYNMDDGDQLERIFEYRIVPQACAALEEGSVFHFRRTERARNLTTATVLKITYSYALVFESRGETVIYKGKNSGNVAPIDGSDPSATNWQAALKIGDQVMYQAEPESWVPAKVESKSKRFLITYNGARGKVEKEEFSEAELSERLPDSGNAGELQDLHPAEPEEKDGDEKKVELILFAEERPLEIPSVDADGNETAEAETPKETKIVEQYYIKFFERSYFHCEWCTKEQVDEYQGTRKLQNFLEKTWHPDYQRKKRRIERLKGRGITDTHKLPYHNLDYLCIDVIFDQDIDEEGDSMFYVKWSSLPYDQATWEWECNIADCHGFQEARRMYDLQELIPPAEQLRTSRDYHLIKNRGPPPTLNIDEVFKGNHKLKKDYQTAGRQWLVHNYHHNMPCILADEMGLGKTVQTVSFVHYLVNMHKNRGPYLVVAPLSTLGHWAREFRAWTDLNVIVYHGNAKARETIVEHHWGWNSNERISRYNTKFHVLISTSQLVLKDAEILGNICWESLIVDEAHALKSRKAQVYKRLFDFDKKHCVLLTGTPIQNNMTELFALLHFLQPDKFFNEDVFLREFGEDELANKSADLRARVLNPRLLQRSKALVEPDLLSREEKIIWVEMTLLQKKWYKALYEQNYQKLANIGGEAATKNSLMNISMELRKCCNHPFLLKGCEQTISPYPGTTQEMAFQNLISSAGKLVLLDKLLPKLQKEGHRVLIFSQMSRMLDIIEDYLRGRGHELERIDGSVTGNLRQEAIDRFQSCDDIFAFLLTTRAGGVGINLMAADTVIIYDSDWNPMNDLQAVSRAHRIGQKKQVHVYRLVTRNCYEQEMFRRADQKRALNSVVMGKMVEKSKKEIEQVLREGAVAMFLKDEEMETEIQKFANASIEDILESRTEKLDHSKDKKDSDMFSQAVFVANANDAGVDINDADFWERIGVKKQYEQQQALDGLGRRRRRRTVNYREPTDDFNPFKILASDSRFRNDSDYDESGDDEPDELGFVRGLQEFRWGQWERFSEILNKNERQRLGTDHENIKTAAVQTLAIIFTGGRDKKAHLKFLENQAAIHMVADPQLRKDIETELKRDRKAKPARLPSLREAKEENEENGKKKKSKGETMFELLSGVVKDHVDHKRLRDLFENGMDEQYREKVKYQISRIFTFKSICDAFGDDMERIKFKQVKSTKRMPEWWNPDLDLLLTQGCFQYGWGNYTHEQADADGFRKLVKDIPAPKKRKSLRSKKKKPAAKPEEAKKEPSFEEKLAALKWVNGPLQVDRLKSLSTLFRKQIKEERQKAENARIRKKREEEKRARAEKQRALNEKKRAKADRSPSRNSKKRRFNQAFPEKLELPFQISPTKVILELGVVQHENEYFSHKTYIWPLGFKSKVQGDSTVKKGEKCWYFTEIKKGRNGELEFHVTADDRVDGWRMVGSSASMVWKKVLEEQKEMGMLSNQKSVTVSGTDKMGINHNLVKAAIEYLPNAEKCKRYTFKYNKALIKKKQPQPKMTEYWPVLKSAKPKLIPKEAIPMEGKFVDKLSFDELESAHTTDSITDRNEPRATTRVKMSDDDILSWIKTQNNGHSLTPTLLRTSLGIGYNRAKQFLTKHFGYVATVKEERDVQDLKYAKIPTINSSYNHVRKTNGFHSRPIHSHATLQTELKRSAGETFHLPAAKKVRLEDVTNSAL